MDAGLFGSGNVNLLHSEDILVPGGKDLLCRLGAEGCHPLPILRAQLSLNHLLAQLIHTLEDPATEIDSQCLILIPRVESEGLLAVVFEEEVSLAGGAAQHELYGIYATGFVLGDADQLLVLGARVVLFYIFCNAIANGKPRASVAVKLRSLFEVVIHIYGARELRSSGRRGIAHFTSTNSQIIYSHSCISSLEKLFPRHS